MMAVEQKQSFLKNIKDPKKSILLNKDKLKIGRGRDMSVCLLSVMISKHHATINRIDEKWTITDENSMNGVFINEKQLDPLVPYPIKENDIIQIGKCKDQPFSYTFQSRIIIKNKNGKLKLEKNLSSCDKVPVSSKDTSFKMSPSQQIVLLSNNQSSSAPLSVDCSSSKTDLNSDSIIKKETSKRKKRAKSPSCPDNKHQKLLEYEKNLQEMKERLKASEDALKQEKEFSSNQANLIKSLSCEMEGARKELEEVQEKENLLLKMREEEKSAIEEEMNMRETELRMRDIANQVELQDLLESKSRLEQIVASKNTEQKLLQKQLEEAKKASEKEKESALKIKDNMLSNFAELMETELQCSICNELFVQATTLNCTHSFCAFCINEWLKRKRTCPICRTRVTSSACALVLDTYIEKMVSQFSDEMKERREQMIKDRKAVKLTFPKPEKQWSNGQFIPDFDELIETVMPPLGWPEDASEDEVMSDESAEWMDGVSTAYFGGYGRCYICDQRGHWANGCPFR